MTYLLAEIFEQGLPAARPARHVLRMVLKRAHRLSRPSRRVTPGHVVDVAALGNMGSYRIWLAGDCPGTLIQWLDASITKGDTWNREKQIPILVFALFRLRLRLLYVLITDVTNDRFRFRDNEGDRWTYERR